MAGYEVVLELEAQPLTEGDGLGRDCRRSRKIGKEKQEGQSIIKVSQSVDEGRISLFYDVVKRYFCCAVPLQSSGITNFPPR